MGSHIRVSYPICALHTKVTALHVIKVLEWHLLHEWLQCAICDQDSETLKLLYVYRYVISMWFLLFCSFCCLLSWSSLLNYLYCLWHCVYLQSLPGLSVIADLTPPSEVQSSNNTAANGSTRYNLNTGAAFNISCSFTHTSDSFSSYFYKDGVVISDGSLVNTTLTELHPSTNQTFIQLQFLNFQPVHDGVYYCSANTSDTNETVTSDLYLYGSGAESMCAWVDEPSHVYMLLNTLEQFPSFRFMTIEVHYSSLHTVYLDAVEVQCCMMSLLVLEQNC